MTSSTAVSACCFELLLHQLIACTEESTRSSGVVDEDEVREIVASKIESLGFDVGFRFMERCAQSKLVSLAASADPAKSGLELVKFLCKDFWSEIFNKQIDKLQTNHRGVFVLKDYNLQWLARLSGDEQQVKLVAAQLLRFPCGLLRGALANLGIASVVSAEHAQPPSAAFQLRFGSHGERAPAGSLQK